MTYDPGFEVGTSDPTIKRVCALIGYTGRRVCLCTFSGPMQLHSYWDGGSRDYFYFARLADMAIVELGSNHPVFESGRPNEIKTLPQGFVIVRHSIFCGKDMGIRIYANQGELTPLLPISTESVTLDEKIVLYATRSLKNSYGGVSDCRFHSATRAVGITRERWEAAKTSLIERKLLNKAGAITADGRNMVRGLLNWPKE